MADQVQTRVSAVSTDSGEPTSAQRVHDPIEAQLLKIWRELLQLDDISLTDDFFDLGGHSILGIHLMAAIEKQFGKKFDVSQLFATPTIESLAREIRASKAAETQFIVPIRPAGSQLPLFCVHCATGHVLRYRALVPHLDSSIPVYGLRAPAFVPGQKVPTVEHLAELYLEDIRKIQPKGPYRICGFSFGGLIAFEMARQLESQGERVSMLSLLDAFNSTHYNHMPLPRAARFYSIYFTDRVSRYLRLLFGGEWGKLQTNVKNRLSWRRRELRWKFYGMDGGKAPDSDASVDLRDNVIRFAHVGWDFAPQPYGGKIYLIRAQQREPEFNIDRNLGWGEVAANIDVRFVSGDHFSIWEEPSVSGLAEALMSCIREEDQNTPAK